MKGPRPQSSLTRKLTGQDKAHPERVNNAEPTPPPGTPDKPDYLDEIASASWDRLVKLFSEMGMLNKADATLMELYAVTYSGYRQALVSVTKTGQVLLLRVDDTKGQKMEVRRNPYSVELHKYMDRLGKLLAEMGLTPSSRTRVAVNPIEGTDDPLAAILRKRAERN